MKKYTLPLCLIIGAIAILPAFSQTPEDPQPPPLPIKTTITTADKKTFPGVPLVESRDANGVTIILDGKKTYIKYENLWEGTAKYLQGTGPYVQYFAHLDPTSPKSKGVQIVWEMLARADVVTLAGKEIPDGFKRTKITDIKGRTIVGDWLEIDRKNSVVKFKREGEGTEEVSIPFESLSEPDRRYAELETGHQWLPVNLRGTEISKFDPGQSVDPGGRISVYQIAFGELVKGFSSQEIFDHLRVRTLTSSFIYDYYDYLVKNPDAQDQRLIRHFQLNKKTLQEVVAMLSHTEPANENVSLAENIAKFGLKPYAEKVPTDPVDRHLTGPNTIPRDSRLQALHFVAEYKNLAAGNPKTSLATLIANATPERPPGKRYDAYPLQHSDPYLNYDTDFVEIGIAKTYGFKNWSIPKFSYSEKSNLNEFLGGKIARHQLRHNQPVVAGYIHPEKANGRQLGSHAILTGFITKDGKITYDVIVLKGAIPYPFPPPKPFEVIELKGIKSSEISFHTVSLLD